MDLMQIATQLLTQQFKDKVSPENAKSALSGLMGDGKGGINITDIISKMSGSGNMASMVGSWLGDGGNDGIQPAQILEIFGGDKIATFSKALGIGEEDASSGLANVIPDLIDKSSSGGNLLSSMGGLGGAMNMAKKHF
jgi:uncharacterized protein YidB (DUF937 family)